MADESSKRNSACDLSSTMMSSDGYFDSYTDLKVHEVMLRDWPRNSAYRRFFEQNAELVRDKVVMDVGAGTGILSLFAASVGARKVYAIEASSTADLCREIVAQNGFSEKIEVIHSRVEDVHLEEGEKVDVLVSEWMGFYLLHESMLDSVIIARDRFLAKDGIVVPSSATIHLAPVNMDNFLEEKYDFWSNVCGFDFSPAISHVHHRLLQEPLTTELDPFQVKATPKILRQFDLQSVTLDEVRSLSELLTFSVEKTTTVHGFALWFDVDFRQGKELKQALQNLDCAPNTQSGEASFRVAGEATSAAHGDMTFPEGVRDWRIVPLAVLSTSPASPITHWKQTVIFLPKPLAVSSGDLVACRVTLAQDKVNYRHYNIELEMVKEEEREEEEDVEEDEEDEESEDEDDDHAIPCDCGRGKCRLIKALTEKYGEEQGALEMEAAAVDLAAEVEAAQAVAEEMVQDKDLNISDQL